MRRRKPDSNCRECGLFKLCESPLMEGEGAEHPDALFVGEAPGAMEDEDDTPFTGRTGELLRKKVEKKIPAKRCRFSNAVRCHPPDNRLKDYPQAIDRCRSKILREIHVADPKVVVLLGNTAIQSVLRRKGILKLHGEVLSPKKGVGRHYICCVHPAYVLRNPGFEKEFERAISIVADLLSGEHHKAKKVWKEVLIKPLSKKNWRKVLVR